MIPQKLKLPLKIFETFPRFFLPSTVSKNTIKMTGHHSRLRDVTGPQSYPIYGCTRANHARYSSVQIIFCGSSRHNLLKQYFGKNLTRRKFRAYGIMSYKSCRKITPTLTSCFHSHSRCFRGHNLHSRVRLFAGFYQYLFFLPIKCFVNFFKLKKMIYTPLLKCL